MTNQDPSVQAAIAQAERMVRLEEGQGAILGHVERIETHLVTQNGRIGKTEDALSQTTAALTQHLNQIADRQEFPRLVALEGRVSTIEATEADRSGVKKGEAVATKRFMAWLAAGIAVFMGIADMIGRPIVGKLLGLE